jgi:hypothetical protein
LRQGLSIELLRLAAPLFRIQPGGLPESIVLRSRMRREE